MKTAELAEPFNFTRGLKTLKMAGNAFMAKAYEFGDLLFDLETDPQQKHPINDPEIEARMKHEMIRLMRENDAPKEQFEHLGL